MDKPSCILIILGPDLDKFIDIIFLHWQSMSLRIPQKGINDDRYDKIDENLCCQYLENDEECK